MFLLIKLSCMLALLWVAWFALRLAEGGAAKNDDKQDDKQSESKSESPADAASVDLRECSQCGAFVPERGCDKPSCPLKK